MNQSLLNNITAKFSFSNLALSSYSHKKLIWIFIFIALIWFNLHQKTPLSVEQQAFNAAVVPILESVQSNNLTLENSKSLSTLEIEINSIGKENEGASYQPSLRKWIFKYNNTVDNTNVESTHVENREKILRLLGLLYEGKLFNYSGGEAALRKDEFLVMCNLNGRKFVSKFAVDDFNKNPAAGTFIKLAQLYSNK